MTHRFLLLASVLLFTGCPTETPAGDTGPLTFPDCEAIVEACHDPAEAGGGTVIQDCHDASHDATSNADCAPLRASCVAACQAFDGGVVEDAGTAEDAPHDHTH